MGRMVNLNDFKSVLNGIKTGLLNDDRISVEFMEVINNHLDDNTIQSLAAGSEKIMNEEKEKIRQPKFLKDNRKKLIIVVLVTLVFLILLIAGFVAEESPGFLRWLFTVIVGGLDVFLMYKVKKRHDLEVISREEKDSVVIRFKIFDYLSKNLEKRLMEIAK